MPRLFDLPLPCAVRANQFPLSGVIWAQAQLRVLLSGLALVGGTPPTHPSSQRRASIPPSIAHPPATVCALNRPSSLNRVARRRRCIHPRVWMRGVLVGGRCLLPPALLLHFSARRRLTSWAAVWSATFSPHALAAVVAHIQSCFIHCPGCSPTALPFPPTRPCTALCFSL